MRTNRTKEMIKAGKPTFGSWVHSISPVVTEVLARQGFDWLLLDLEHIAGETTTLLQQMQAMNGTDTTIVARVPWNDPVHVKRVMDLGVEGVMLPWVYNAEQARAAVAACKYPPQGIRGVGPLRASNYGAETAEYLKRSNDEVLVIIQLEHIDTVNNIEEYVAVEGVDVVFIGPADLSASMGLLGQFRHPDVVAAMSKVVQACKKAGVALATVAFDTAHAKQLVEEGYQFLTIGGDIQFLAQGAKAALAGVGRG